MSSSVQHFTESSQAHDRRISQRILPRTLIYVACGESNGGMVLNVSNDGLAVSMAIAVGDESYSHLNVRMNGLSQSIEVPGRIVWTTKSKKRAGIQLMDVSDTQREQIREWISLEGVRDVNLLPRAVADDVDSFRVAEPRSTLLDAFGGTPPETLGPPLAELFASESAAAATTEPLPSQGFDDVRSVAFRENEWDLASVTVVPRRRPKPEGLSAFALILLWIAIPSFAIGILVGRRPLEQWLSRGDAGSALPKKSRSPSFPSATLPSAASELSDPGHQADVKFSQEVPPNLPINTEPFDNDLLAIKPAENYRSGGSSALVDAKLLNSMSTQEARAFKNVGSASEPSTTSPHQNNLDSKGSLATNGPAAPEIVPPKSTSATANISPNVSGPTRGLTPNAATATAQVQNVTPPLTSTNSSSRISQPQPFRDSNSSTIHQNSVGTGARSLAPTASAPASISATGSSENPHNTNRDVVPSAASNNTSAPLTAPNAGSANFVSPAAPVSPSVVPPVVPNSAPKFAPPSFQPPLRGVMNVARSTDQAFVLKLPAESVPGGQSASMRMQRFVMVPQRGLWHRHNAVAKLKVGELLTRVSPEKPDAKVQPRQGDTVTVRAFVDKEGAVRDLKPVSGRFALMPRVMRTVRDWQFDQTLVDGKSVESEVNVTVEYRGAN